MQLDHHLAQVHDQLAAAAALGDDRTREIAATLATTATAAVRLALMNAVSQAADEITAALLDYPGSPAVGVRLDGDEITVDVRGPDPAAAAGDARRDDGEPSARISLRLSETLKADIDEAADRDGVSVNTWLVRAATAALDPGPFGLGGFAARAFGGSGFGPVGFGPFGGPGRRGGGGSASGEGRRGGHGDTHNITGWIDG
jgi:hypothetical protein